MTGELVTVQVSDIWITIGESTVEGCGKTREESVDDYCNQLLLMNPGKGLFRIGNEAVEVVGINTVGTSSELDIIFDKARDSSGDTFWPVGDVIEMNIKEEKDA